jgi:hypothetical protein
MNGGPLAALRPLSRHVPEMDVERVARAALLGLVCLWLFVFVVLPLSTLVARSVTDKADSSGGSTISCAISRPPPWPPPFATAFWSRS